VPGGTRLIIVKEVGERKVIEAIRQELAFPRTPIPFGDDVSGVRIERDKVAVLKTDMLVGKTDVPLGMSFWQAGRKAVVMNVSDFAAKGVKPLALLVSLGIPSSFLEDDVVQLAKGLNAGAREYGAYVLGGDTGEACDLVISCSLFGVAERRLIPLRSGARVGDVVAVTGLFGRSAAGLKIFRRDVSSSTPFRKVFLNAVLLPKARLKEGLALALTKVVSASIDSSDGLSWSLHEIARASRVGLLIDNLPIAPEVLQFAKRNKLDPLELALYGGEEYELVLTIKPRFWQKALRAVNHVGGSLFRIGQVTEKTDKILQWNRKTVAIEPKGWEHFKSRV
jgi:thiamine-monophosphate kinase